ncbi:APC family permease [Dactylosporangium sp. CS-047395]|uniref:APC family permease n=1 Tax=Dactylosporangium sp. CS-047395 TaxID=3239936 RepID=UPI003D94B8AF
MKHVLHPSPVTTALTRGRLGAVALSGPLLAAVTPLVVILGVVPIAYASGLIAIPLALLVVAVVLAVFLAAYLTMAKHVQQPGGFFAYISLGLGRPLGVAAALVAALAYSMLQIGLYGLLGASMAEMAHDWVDLPWWGWALLVGGVVACLGPARVDIGAWVLAALVCLEMVAIVLLSLRGLSHPAGGHVTLAAFDPRLLVAGGATAAFSIVVLAFVGVEQAATYATQVKHGRRTMLLASFGVLLSVGAVYLLGSWAPQVFYGDAVVAEAADPSMMVAMAGDGPLASWVQIQLLLSVSAALLPFHNATVQYLYGLGKQGLLPRPLGRTNSFDAPGWASLWQSVLAAATIGVVAITGWDPVTGMFYYLGNAGGFGVLLLLALTSVAVWRYFHRDGCGETVWARLIAPVAAGIALWAMVALVASNYATLLNVPPDAVAAWAWPASFLIPAAVGMLLAGYMRWQRPATYAAMLHDTAPRPLAYGPARSSVRGGTR